MIWFGVIRRRIRFLEWNWSDFLMVDPLRLIHPTRALTIWPNPSIYAVLQALNCRKYASLHHTNARLKNDQLGPSLRLA